MLGEGGAWKGAPHAAHIENIHKLAIRRTGDGITRIFHGLYDFGRRGVQAGYAGSGR